MFSGASTSVSFPRGFLVSFQIVQQGQGSIPLLVLEVLNRSIFGLNGNLSSTAVVFVLLALETGLEDRVRGFGFKGTEEGGDRGVLEHLLVVIEKKAAEEPSEKRVTSGQWARIGGGFDQECLQRDTSFLKGRAKGLGLSQ